MASNDTNRIIKDTSARKRPDIEALTEASFAEKKRELYNRMLIENCNQQLEERDIECSQQLEDRDRSWNEHVESLQEKHSMKINALEEEARNAFQAGEERAGKECASEITKLKDQSADWERKYKFLQQTFQRNLQEIKAELAAERAEKAAIEDVSQANIEFHTIQVNDLRSRESIYLHFKCNGLTTRTYLRRTTEPFSWVADELRKNLRRWSWARHFSSTDVAARHHLANRWQYVQGIQEFDPQDKTLAEVQFVATTVHGIYLC